MVLESVFGALYAGDVALSLWSLAQVRRFLRQTPAIDEDGLRRYKDFVRVQMYLALVVIGLLATGMVIGLVLIASHGLAGLGAVLAANAVVFVLGLVHRSWEVRALSLEAGTDALRAEYQEVTHAWRHKPLPDF